MSSAQASGQQDQPLEMTIDLDNRPDTAIVRLSGSASVANSIRFERSLTSLYSRREKNIVLDLADLTFISTLGVGAFIALHKTQKQRGGTLRIARAGPFVLGVLQRCRLHEFLEIYPTLEDALK